MKKVLVALSGGIDSSYLIALAKSRGHDVTALVLDNGDPSYPEIVASKAVAEHFEVPVIMALNPRQDSLFVQYPIVPDADAQGQAAAASSGLKYISGFKGMLYALLLSYGAARGTDEVWIGANAWNNHYADEIPERVQTFREGWIALYPELKMPTIEFPLMGLDKPWIIQQAARLGVPFDVTYSCGLDAVPPCGTCVSCTHRSEEFQLAGVLDTGLGFSNYQSLTVKYA